MRRPDDFTGTRFDWALYDAHESLLLEMCATDDPTERAAYQAILKEIRRHERPRYEAPPIDAATLAACRMKETTP